MEPIEEKVEGFYTWSDRLQKRLSDDWRQHANRRTLIVAIVLGALAAFIYLFGIQAPARFPTDQLVTVPQEHRWIRSRKHCMKTASYAVRSHSNFW